MEANKVLRTAETILGAAATSRALPTPWGTVLSVASAAIGLAADLAENGLNPEQSIEAMRSAVPAFAASGVRLREYLTALERQGHT